MKPLWQCNLCTFSYHDQDIITCAFHPPAHPPAHSVAKLLVDELPGLQTGQWSLGQQQPRLLYLQNVDTLDGQHDVKSWRSMSIFIGVVVLDGRD